MNTFSEIADRHSLSGSRKELYIAYMKARWANEEQTMTQTGYADEWAQRFVQRIEYATSDMIGQSILDSLYEPQQ